jgi:hypothetical protein
MRVDGGPALDSPDSPDSPDSVAEVGVLNVEDTLSEFPAL